MLIMKTYRIDGKRFSSLEGFYKEISRVLVPGVYWGHNLDAFNDILRGGFGTPDEGFALIWENSETSKRSLGYPEAVRHLQQRLESCHPSNRHSVEAQLRDAENYGGDTVFDWLVEIIRVHSTGGEEASDNIVLELR